MTWCSNFVCLQCKAQLIKGKVNIFGLCYISKNFMTGCSNFVCLQYKARLIKGKVNIFGRYYTTKDFMA